MGVRLYVNELKISYPGKSECVNEPNLELIMKVLNEIEDKKLHYIELNNTNENVGMVIFGDPGLYQIGIVNEDTDEIYYYCNGMKPTEELVGIAGNLYSKHMVCYDFTTCLKIVEEFCKNGERLKEVDWIYEEG